ncbi:MAG TPA: S41 family peptidase [Longimicrobiales bacterium]
MKRIILRTTSCLTLALAIPATTSAQTRRGNDIAEAKRALSSAYSDLKRSYYDPDLHGLNLDSIYAIARDELDNARTTQQRYRAIARFMEAFDDSHTGFIAPWRVALGDYHFGLHFYGDKPFITHVDPDSHAERVGLRRGDEIVRFAGFELTRANYYHVLLEFLSADSIQPLPLTVRGPDGSLSELRLAADTMEILRMKGSEFRKLLSTSTDSSEVATSHVQVSIADSVFVWRFPRFAHVDRGLDDVAERARKHRVIIIDLRGNHGGSVETLTKALGYFVDKELIVGDLRTRISKETYTAKPKKKHVGGRIFILIDSETASAAEMFTRLLQLQGKATVIGDRSAGKVMASQYFPADDYMGAQITVSDVVLYNGERLEKVGVTPDILAVEEPRHLVAGGDPVLALALLRAGVRVSPAIAGRILPMIN